jgi:4-hydroxy-tetrahydrodipicolinate synthase
MTGAIGGLWVALATPLDAGGGVDQAVLTRHARWLLGQGCDGLVLFGTTGEGTSFSAAERLASAEALLGAGIAPERIGLGAGYPAIPDSIALTRQALGLGLRHVLLLPPYFYRDVGTQGIEDAFSAVLDGVGDDRLRATLYHIPQVSGVPVPAETAARLRARYGRVVAGVKDSSGDFTHFQSFRAAAPEVAVTIGNEADIGRALAAGGAGTICGMANLVPQMVRAMFTDPDAAEPMREAIALITDPFVPALKAALAALTGEPAWARVRAPLRPADAAQGERVAAGVRKLQVPQGG